MVIGKVCCPFQTVPASTVRCKLQRPQPTPNSAHFRAGMALHDKAKKLLKLREYDSCLPLLIEADLCFSRCTDGIIGRVDNVALCHLDIVWCYLSLR